MLTWKVHARLPPGLAGSLFSGESDGDAEEEATAAAAVAEVVAAAAAFSTEKLSIPGAERFLLLRENETNMVVVWWGGVVVVRGRRWERRARCARARAMKRMRAARSKVRPYPTSTAATDGATTVAVLGAPAM